MQLSQLTIGLIKGPLSHDPVIKGISADSRSIDKGYVFFALKGQRKDGSSYIPDAIKKGAVAVILDDTAPFDTNAIPASIPLLRVGKAREALSLMSARFYQTQPATIAAITGTSGKTSTMAFTQQIWHGLGYKAAGIGTIGVVQQDSNTYGGLTTPDPVALHATLNKLHKGGVTHVAMEASSHGLDQSRLAGVVLKAAAFTNLGRDHLDYHATIDTYLETKLQLFSSLLPEGAPAIINADDRYADKVIAYVEAEGRQALTIGRKGRFITLLRTEQARYSQYIECRIGQKIFAATVPLAGEFQVYNILVACGIIIALGAEPTKVFAQLEYLKGVSGRLEWAGATAQGAPIYIDYAHKPEALEQVLLAIRPFTTGKIVLILGCGGDRDQGKRPLMGAIAARYADQVIVTDDNPRTEDPAIIRAQIIQAAPNAIEIANRATAIRHAIKLLQPHDCLIIAGKGHERGQIIGETTHPFSDHEEVVRALGDQ